MCRTVKVEEKLFSGKITSRHTVCMFYELHVKSRMFNVFLENCQTFDRHKKQFPYSHNCRITMQCEQRDCFRCFSPCLPVNQDISYVLKSCASILLQNNTKPTLQHQLMFYYAAGSAELFIRCFTFLLPLFAIKVRV